MEGGDIKAGEKEKAFGQVSQLDKENLSRRLEQSQRENNARPASQGQRKEMLSRVYEIEKTRYDDTTKASFVASKSMAFGAFIAHFRCFTAFHRHSATPGNGARNLPAPRAQVGTIGRG